MTIAVKDYRAIREALKLIDYEKLNDRERDVYVAAMVSVEKLDGIKAKMTESNREYMAQYRMRRAELEREKRFDLFGDDSDD